MYIAKPHTWYIVWLEGTLKPKERNITAISVWRAASLGRNVVLDERVQYTYIHQYIHTVGIYM